MDETLTIGCPTRINMNNAWARDDAEGQPMRNVDLFSLTSQMLCLTDPDRPSESSLIARDGS